MLPRRQSRMLRALFCCFSNTDFLFLLSGYDAEGKRFPEEIYKYLGERARTASASHDAAGELEHASSEFVAAFEGNNLQARNVIEFHHHESQFGYLRDDCVSITILRYRTSSRSQLIKSSNAL